MAEVMRCPCGDVAIVRCKSCDRCLCISHNWPRGSCKYCETSVDGRPNEASGTLAGPVTCQCGILATQRCLLCDTAVCASHGGLGYCWSCRRNTEQDRQSKHEELKRLLAKLSFLDTERLRQLVEKLEPQPSGLALYQLQSWRIAGGKFVDGHSKGERTTFVRLIEMDVRLLRHRDPHSERPETTFFISADGRVLCWVPKQLGMIPQCVDSTAEYGSRPPTRAMGRWRSSGERGLTVPDPHYLIDVRGGFDDDVRPLAQFDSGRSSLLSCLSDGLSSSYQYGPLQFLREAFR
jgi:hypothetical protein